MLPSHAPTANLSAARRDTLNETQQDAERAFRRLQATQPGEVRSYEASDKLALLMQQSAHIFSDGIEPAPARRTTNLKTTSPEDEGDVASGSPKAQPTAKAKSGFLAKWLRRK